MCGISGYISHSRITKEELKTMNDTMYHRGPDDEGVEIYDAPSGYAVGFAQRRLSIQDLSPLGHQPMHSPNGRVSVVFNGEIYNYPMLKTELAATGFSFKSTCDTEVIIAAYEKWGIDFVNRLNGMFAIALYDRGEECVFFIRDRIGKKPFYYELEEKPEGINLYFGSELKPIMKRPGFEKNINTKCVGRFLYQQYIHAPETIFDNVYKLEPGAVLQFDLNKKPDYNSQVSVYKYWDINSIYHKMVKDPVRDYQEAKMVLKALLQKSVSDRMISDVPLGTFLSGGYDSSLITAMAQEVSKEKVKTFSIGFNVEKYNEAKYAKEVAEYLGTDHTEMYISEEEMYDLVRSIPTYYDEPFADSSQICTMLVSALAKERVTVALSGDGGDEFFCGYNVYQKIKDAQTLDSIGAVTNAVINLPGINKADLASKLPFKARMIVNNRNKETKTQFGMGAYATRAMELVLGEQESPVYEFETKYGIANWQIRRMLLDMETYLPGDILCKVDRASMKYSLETRCPILDKDVMEYSFRLNHSFKYDKGNKKRILKDIVYDYIPRELMDRPKVGFAVPMDQWLHGPLKEELLSMTDKAYLKNQGIFDDEALSTFVYDYLKGRDAGPSSGKNYSKLVWSVFAFQQWYKAYFS